MKLPQLSVRDLFWLVLVAAMGCGWWLDRIRMHQLVETHRKESDWIKRALLDLGWTISKDGPDSGQPPLTPPYDFQIPPLESDKRR